MIFSARGPTRTILQIALVGLAVQAARGAADQAKEDTRDQLALSAECVNGSTVRPVRTYVEWKGCEYQLDTGIDVVMSVVRDRKASVKDRRSALMQLAMLMTQLHGHPCLDELAALYDDAEGVEKKPILTCFGGSRDPRAIPIFVRTLDKERDPKLRLSAAAGLAQWNVRRGVAELMNLLDSSEVLPQPARMPYVRDNAMDLLRTKNRLKGWGLPDEEIQKSIKDRSDLNDDEKRALYNTEVKKWFAENEQRFPDWKVGDPLPEVEVDRKPSQEDSHAEEGTP